MQKSGRNNACPSCGRVSDGDCRWDDHTIFCHVGETCRPDPTLKIGDTIDVSGQSWALVKVNTGYSGQAHLFKPHRPKPETSRRSYRPSRPTRQRSTDVSAKRALYGVAIERFSKAYRKAMDVMDFFQLSPAELKQAVIDVDEAQERAAEMRVTAPTIWRECPDLAQLHRQRIEANCRDLKYQADDLRHFRSYYLGEVV